MKVGVLALQGAVEPHCAMLQGLGAIPVRVRTPTDLAGVDRLIMPGGESTTMLKLLKLSGLFAAIQDFASAKPLWGICAGAILLAEEVRHPTQESLGIMPIRATRNYYGSQLDSFKASLTIDAIGRPMEIDFIRAPLLEPLNETVTVLAKYQEQPVLMQSGAVLASAFHTEGGTDSGLHQLFLSLNG